MKRFLFFLLVLFTTVSLAKANELNLQNIIKEGDYKTEKKIFQNLTEEQLDNELKNGTAFNSMPNYLNELFIKVVKHNPNPVLTKKLLSAGADVNYKDKYKDIPLVSAIQYNKNPEVVKMLIKAGSKINHRNEFGRSAVFYSRTVEVASALVKAGANLNVKNNNQETALMRALANNHLDIARYLIEAGADVTVKDKDGNTALVYLLDRDEKVDAPDIVQMMIDGGVDVNASKCQIPLEYAHVCGLKETEKLLVKAGAKAKSSFDRLERIGLNCEKYSQITCTIWH